MTAYEEFRSKIEKMSDERGDLIMLEDGYVYYFPIRSGGAISSCELRILDDILDDRNTTWDQEVRGTDMLGGRYE
ncbi:MAG: hypothetical protein ACRCZI_01020 [Cetobacterium sp.]